MDAALLADKHEFVNLFLDHAVVDIEEYLNEPRLLKLYNQSKEVLSIGRCCRPIGATFQHPIYYHLCFLEHNNVEIHSSDKAKGVCVSLRISVH